ncbi:MAG TPA: sigma-54 dependent transcriptional regulator [Myxococcales bacterium]|jgi:DNA-binding NtrC family response regulator|nr:sigma-54 dependent transcriptional regulator [Myxococcales bacterium]
MGTKQRILIVDDEQNARTALRTLLGEEGYEIAEAADGEEALSKIAELDPEVVLTDMRMPKMDGITLIKKARESGSEAAFVMMTAYASVEAAVDAMKAGAENYLIKPLNLQAVLVFLEKALEKRSLQRETVSLRDRVREQYRLEGLVGDAPELRAVYEVVRQAASTKATVLVLGESGTGKEIIAHALHEESPRRDQPFVKVSCAALSETLLESELFGHERGSFTGALGRKEGRFELGDGGTLFLDEIGEISPATQVKLLRVLQTREFERVGGTQTLKVDVRLVAATNRDLVAEVKAGRFREDLYYRLNVVAVTLPPLRRRKGDLPALSWHFIEKYARLYGKDVHRLGEGTLNALLAHDWPGNVRELENAIECAVVLAQTQEITPEDLPCWLRGSRPNRGEAGSLIPGGTLYEIEREAILRTLELVGGSTSRAADLLKISARKIQYRLKEYAQTEQQGLRPQEAAPAAN